MDCKITSTKRRKRGFTLVELVAATGLSSMVGVAVGNLLLYSGRSFASIANYVSLDRASRNALDVMSQQIRQTKRLTSSTTNNLVFEDSDGGTLSFTYYPQSRTLQRAKNGVADPTPLLTECDSLQFSIFQRNPIGGSYGVYPTATAATAKLVQMNWICSREIFGTKFNTESVQSAKIVIRKQ